MFPILGISGAPDVAFPVGRSLRFRAGASQYLSRTSPSGNRQTWTFSAWWKRGAFSGTTQCLFSAGTTNRLGLFIDYSGNDIQLHGNGAVLRATTPVFRDPTAWYHIHVLFNTPDATAQSRARIWINGVEITSWSQNNTITQNANYDIGSAITQYICRNTDGGDRYGNCLLAEVNFVDGSALLPSSFGQTDPASGAWVTKKYTGSYGTAGFRLDFSDNSNTTASTLGADRSGNGNNWTPNSLSVTAGVTNDSLIDTPTNNHCIMSGVDSSAGSTTVATEGGLKLASTSGGSYISRRSSFGMSSGKWYMEWTAVGSSNYSSGRVGIGLYKVNGLLNNYGGADANSWGYIGQSTTGAVYNNGASTLSLTSGNFTTNDVLMAAFDADTGKLWFGKNGTWLNSGDPATATSPHVSSLTSGPYFFGGWSYNTSDIGVFNFGQRPFVYTPPSGFKSLCAKNLSGAGSTTVTGSFTGNANADGPSVWLGYPPDKTGTCTINGNAITWGTHADALANGIKLKTSSTSYNASGSNTFSIAVKPAIPFRRATAQVNP